jgi:hypothetical protein
MIVAALALVFAMVGTAVAGTDGISSKLTKSKVKSIAKKQADKELKANVAGSHVNTADNATNATNATTAGSAGNINGASLQHFNYNVNSTATQTTILNAGGFVLKADCSGATLDVSASTTTNNSWLGSSSITVDSVDTISNEVEVEPFDVGDNIDILPDDNTAVSGHTTFISGAGNANVQVEWGAENDIGDFDCNFAGTAVVG